MTKPTGVYRTRAEWIDTDAAGIHHNTTINRFVEAAEAELMRERRLEGCFPVAPRVRFEVDYEAPTSRTAVARSVERVAAPSTASTE